MRDILTAALGVFTERTTRSAQAAVRHCYSGLEEWRRWAGVVMDCAWGNSKRGGAWG